MTVPHKNLESAKVQAQAIAVRNLLEKSGDGLHAQSRMLIESAIESLNNLRPKERTPPQRTTNIRMLPDSATQSEINRARMRQSVQLGSDVFLPYLPTGTLALPNSLLRSALFAITAVSEHLFNERIPTQGDASIFLDGPRLLDYDRQVWAVLLQAASDLPLKATEDSEWHSISLHQLSKSLHSAPGANVYKAIATSLQRLSEAHLRVRTAGVNVTIERLIDVNFGGTDGKRLVQFRVTKEVAELFGANNWTRLSTTFLQNAKGYAGWISAFYSTHAKSYPLKVADLLKLTGSQGSLAEFRRKIQTALTTLSNESVPLEFRVASWTLTKDLLTVYLSRWNELDGISPEEKELKLNIRI